MKIIRTHVFETNSSSTHSVVIGRDTPIKNIPQYIHISVEDFGRDNTIIDSIEDKANYLLSSIVSSVDSAYMLRKFRKLMKDMGVRIIYDKGDYDTYIKPTIKAVVSSNEAVYSDDGYFIDHGPDNEWLEFTLNSEDNLKSYLFSDQIFVLVEADYGGFDEDDHKWVVCPKAFKETNTDQYVYSNSSEESSEESKIPDFWKERLDKMTTPIIKVFTIN